MSRPHGRRRKPVDSFLRVVHIDNMFSLNGLKQCSIRHRTSPASPSDLLTLVTAELRINVNIQLRLTRSLLLLQINVSCVPFLAKTFPCFLQFDMRQQGNTWHFAGLSNVWKLSQKQHIDIRTGTTSCKHIDIARRTVRSRGKSYNRLKNLMPNK
jgi:hypothetical protein